MRAQLLSAEHMERHGRLLARAHQLSARPSPDRLLGRLSDNQLVIDHACALFTAAAHANRRLTPACEWLLDNAYLIDEQVATARRHLPKGYSRELPQLRNGASAGLPRVYDIALNAIAYGDGRVDADSLGRFIAAYQAVTPLTLGELWAIPIMLRLALIENLRRIGARLIVDRTDRNLADLWADQLTAVAETDPKSLVLVIADMARSKPPLASSFVAELARRLQGQSSALALPLTWVEQWLADSDQSIEQMVQAENQLQAAEQVSISNSIGSLRLLAVTDWRDFVEAMSAVEGVLRTDPGGTYARMDFATRDRYRHVVERIARRGKLAQTAVAARAIALARARADAEGDDAIAAHVGYYLIDAGRDALEQALGLGRDPATRLRRAARRVPLLAYAAPILLIVAACTVGLLDGARPLPGGTALLVALAALGVIAFSELGVALVNRAVTLFVPPRALPRLDCTFGIPADARTLVVVPTMFGSRAALAELVEALEVRFLANRDPQLRFALLTDFFDADRQELPQDAALLAAARAQVEALNARHAGEQGDVFFLFHRPRTWNPRERCWMGFERKRGKLAALNAFLRGGARDAFALVVGDTAALGHVRYVITLDTDTQLPRAATQESIERR